MIDQPRNHNWLSERAVLAAKNKDVYQLNHFILSSIQSEKVIYKSIDTIVEADEVVNYPSEFLNSLDLPGMPPHVLKLKTGVPVIMLRNVNQPKLCNGTRLAVKKLMNNVVEATILTGPFKGEDILIPRIPMIPTDTPFKFKRLQFPILLAFAITINKAHGQSLELCGLDLSVDCFSHGQLYVACSRVGKPDSLYIYANNVVKVTDSWPVYHEFVPCTTEDHHAEGSAKYVELKWFSWCDVEVKRGRSLDDGSKLRRLSPKALEQLDTMGCQYSSTYLLLTIDSGSIICERSVTLQRLEGKRRTHCVEMLLTTPHSVLDTSAVDYTCKEIFHKYLYLLTFLRILRPGRWSP
ncbi:ATP-dependent DNA helicase [Trichonephila clavipes]|nr:ATP-dependent DNA helicase [Trichonephila clavipes]